MSCGVHCGLWLVTEAIKFSRISVWEEQLVMTV